MTTREPIRVDGNEPEPTGPPRWLVVAVAVAVVGALVLAGLSRPGTEERASPTTTTTIGLVAATTTTTSTVPEAIPGLWADVATFDATTVHLLDTPLGILALASAPPVAGGTALTVRRSIDGIGWTAPRTVDDRPGRLAGAVWTGDRLFAVVRRRPAAGEAPGIVVWSTLDLEEWAVEPLPRALADDESRTVDAVGSFDGRPVIVTTTQQSSAPFVRTRLPDRDRAYLQTSPLAGLDIEPDRIRVIGPFDIVIDELDPVALGIDPRRLATIVDGRTIRRTLFLRDPSGAWTATDADLLPRWGLRLVERPGGELVATGSGATGAFLATSTDARTWQRTPFPADVSFPSLLDDGRIIAFRNVDASTVDAVTSLDGIEWIPLFPIHISPATWGFPGPVADDGLVAVGSADAQAAGDHPTVVVVDDGATSVTFDGTVLQVADDHQVIRLPIDTDIASLSTTVDLDGRTVTFHDDAGASVPVSLATLERAATTFDDRNQTVFHTRIFTAGAAAWTMSRVDGLVSRMLPSRFGRFAVLYRQGTGAGAEWVLLRAPPVHD